MRLRDLVYSGAGARIYVQTDGPDASEAHRKAIEDVASLIDRFGAQSPPPARSPDMNTTARNEILKAAWDTKSTLVSALQGEKVSPPWSAPSMRDVKDWVRGDAGEVTRLKNLLHDHEGSVGDAHRSVLSYVGATLTYDGYMHAGRAFSSVHQIERLIRDLTA